MKRHFLKKWLAIGVAELLVCLVLFAWAPRFLNSNQPIVGFLMWLSAPALVGGSGAYLAARLTKANQARKLFITKFPEYADLPMTEFLDISIARMTRHLELLEAIKDDPDFQTLHLSPLDLFRGSK